jgi:hypothetical protein
MRLYDCKVLLDGSRENEVRKDDVTAAEIMALRLIHGPDSVLEIVPKEMDKRPHGPERARIFRLYADPEALDSQKKTAALTALFGPSHVPLPVELPDAETIHDLDDEAPAAVAPSRVQLPKKAGKAEDVAAAAALA